jgi:hypothetical protein
VLLKTKSAQGENAARTLHLHPLLTLTTQLSYHDFLQSTRPGAGVAPQRCANSTELGIGESERRAEKEARDRA